MKIFKKIKASIAPIGLFTLITFLLFYKIGQIPLGFFCDEAIQAIRAQQLLNLNFSHFKSIFFYQHFNYLIGNLPIIWLTPHIQLFGLNETAVRLASATAGLATLITVYKTFDLLGLETKIKLIAISLIGFSPIFIHISRIYFGHNPSLFLLSLGWFFFIKATYAKTSKHKNRKKTVLFSLLSGALLALSSYGYLAFIVFVPIFLFTVLISQLNFPLNKIKFKPLLLTLLSFLITLLPLILAASNQPQFKNRLIEKSGQASIVSLDKISQMLTNYPKYFSFKFLFSRGEPAFKNSFITRHSVTGKGLLLYSLIPVLILGIVALLLKKRHQKINKYFLPFFLLIILYPITDLIAAKNDQPPYSFALYPAIILVPFVAVAGLNWLKDQINQRHFKICTIVLLAAIIFEGLIFYFKIYQKYPSTSSNYWGWQYGAKPSATYFKNNYHNYDQLFLEGKFNQANTLLDFYLYNHPAKNKSQIGDLSQFNPNEKQLFTISAETWNNPQLPFKDMTQFKIVETIKYPQNKPAFYLISDE